MCDFLEGLKEEHAALALRITDLNKFIYGKGVLNIFKSLDELEQVRIIKQVGFMESYASVLEARIWTTVSK